MEASVSFVLISEGELNALLALCLLLNKCYAHTRLKMLHLSAGMIRIKLW